ncbi:MAG TPA: pilus assembly protein TadG-related protein [Mesorhizobium sp.]|jgi:Flp pilus assembly protein TadG|nr:pilus assembly protein TadG-related protein [Mesorhizobium sp.]
MALHRFACCRGGHFAVLLGLLAPVLLGLTGGAIDLFRYVSHQKSLQSAADGAALAAAREASLEGWSQAAADAIANAYVQANVSHLNGSGEVTALTTVDGETGRVTVAVEQDHFGYFMVGYFKASPQIHVQATAQAIGSTSMCVIGLSSHEESTIGLDSNAILSAPNCVVHSNSAHAKGMRSLSNAVLRSALPCSAGGYEGAAKNFSKMPLTDCPPMDDPLAGRAKPHVGGACKAKNAVHKDYVGKISPGIYCGGLFIDGNSVVTMEPGVYVMRDGPFLVDSNSKVTGKGVGVFFTGKNSFFHFKSNVNVSLEAPTTGDMYGLIFHQDRDSAPADFTIESNYTRNLIGTIYLPKGKLVVKADNDVADQSAYTAIVVQKLQLLSGPRLVLNTNYDDTAVPVPEGLGPTGEQVLLTR